MSIPTYLLKVNGQYYAGMSQETYKSRNNSFGQFDYKDLEVVRIGG